MKFHIVHSTRYDYSQSVSLCHSEARLMPRNCGGQRCLKSVLKITPEPAYYSERTDFFGNRVVHFAVQHPHKRLTVTATSEIEVDDDVEKPQADDQTAWEVLFRRLHSFEPASTGTPAEEWLEARLYALDSDMAAADDEVKSYAAPSFRPGLSVAEVAQNLTERIYRDFHYDPHFTTIATPLSDVLSHRRGVCQDFAHLAIACFRCYGLPARYVSGYLETDPPPGQTKLAGSDASHAWFSVFQPEGGWIDFDPTNDCRAGERHVTLAWGRDYNDVTPLKGLAVGGGKHRIGVSVDVARNS